MPLPDYDIKGTRRYRLYAALIRPLLASPLRARLFLLVVGASLVAVLVMPALRLVPLKLLPSDNKDEFQIVIDMPEGTTLERTQGVARALGEHLRTVAEVKEFAAFVGTPSPMDFNGMVRHYYLRQKPHFADLRVPWPSANSDGSNRTRSCCASARIWRLSPLPIKPA